jgi:hypothetical protein
MRWTINVASGLFVVLGAAAFVVLIVLAVTMGNAARGVAAGGVYGGLTMLAAAVPAALCILIGGGTWLVGKIEGQLAEQTQLLRRIAQGLGDQAGARGGDPDAGRGRNAG